MFCLGHGSQSSFCLSFPLLSLIVYNAVSYINLGSDSFFSFFFPPPPPKKKKKKKKKNIYIYINIYIYKYIYIYIYNLSHDLCHMHHLFSAIALKAGSDNNTVVMMRICMMKMVITLGYLMKLFHKEVTVEASVNYLKIMTI